MKAGGRIVFLSTTQCHNANVAAPYTLYIATKGPLSAP